MEKKDFPIKIDKKVSQKLLTFKDPNELQTWLENERAKYLWIRQIGTRPTTQLFDYILNIRIFVPRQAAIACLKTVTLNTPCRFYFNYALEAR